MATVQEFLGLLGRKRRTDEIVAIFGAVLDESGTDGRSPYTVVGGAVATANQWDKLETAWKRLLDRSKIPAYHWKEFNYKNDTVFGSWSDFKRSRFVEAQEKIINKNTIFRVSVGIESAIHSDIKRRMRGIKGFSAESDYSLCLRYLMFQTCEMLAKQNKDCQLSILVEDGPFAAGAMKTYQRVAAMTSKWKPAKHAHRLVGFRSAPKGEYFSLEAADYLAGSEHKRLAAKRRPRQKGKTLSLLLTKPLLERWYDGMIKEKEHRRSHNKKKFKKSDS